MRTLEGASRLRRRRRLRCMTRPSLSTTGAGRASIGSTQAMSRIRRNRRRAVEARRDGMMTRKRSDRTTFYRKV